ncbi:hypothetical protein CUC08_Gglean006452 [Alternaria sp. MG1]|nr:hypothetical protein CUC08_Gglean006452 [Alternaria sp. MG1]
MVSFIFIPSMQILVFQASRHRSSDLDAPSFHGILFARLALSLFIRYTVPTLFLLLILPQRTCRHLTLHARLAKHSLHPTPIHFQPPLPIHQHTSINANVRNLKTRSGGLGIINVIMTLLSRLRIRIMKRQTLNLIRDDAFSLCLGYCCIRHIANRRIAFPGCSTPNVLELRLLEEVDSRAVAADVEVFFHVPAFFEADLS